MVVLEHQPISNSVVLSSQKAVGGTYKMSRFASPPNQIFVLDSYGQTKRDSFTSVFSGGSHAP